MATVKKKPAVKSVPVKRVAPDWEAIQAAYRVGVDSLREIGVKAGVTEGAIRKRAKRDSWPRDLGEKIRAKADELVRKEVRSPSTQLTPRTEDEIVQVNAVVMATIRTGQQTDIQRSRKLVMSLLGELEFATDNIDLMDQLGTLMLAPDKNGVDKLNDLYRRVASLSGRVGNVKQLSDSLKTLVALEREAFGIDGPAVNPGDKPTRIELVAL